MVALAQALTITHQSWCRFVGLMVARQAFLVQIDPIAMPAPSAPDSRLTSIPAHPGPARARADVANCFSCGTWLSKMRSMNELPLLERESEVEALKTALEAAARGAGSLILVEGSAGIGKTRLLQETAQLAESTGFLVREARGGELEKELPFGVARQLFERLVQGATTEQRERWLSGSATQAGDLLTGSSEQVTVKGPSDPLTISNSFYWLAANLSTDRPLLLIIDDAQWSDAPSLRFVTFLARRLRDLSVALVIGVRTGEPSEPEELAILRMESVPLQLGPLSAHSVGDLITSWSGSRPASDFTDACVSATGGNPFLVLEVLRELASEQGISDGDAIASLERLAPENVSRTVLFRLARFGADAISLARAIAVLGRAPRLRQAADLAILDEDTARQVSDDLRRAEILASGLPLDFVHPLVRQAIYGELFEAKRSAAHRSAAEILAHSDAPPTEIAAHLLACVPEGDPWVVERLEEAGRSALDDGAFDTAASYFERALQEPPKDDLPLRLLLGKALFVADIFRAPLVLADVAGRATDEHIRLEAEMVLSYSQIQTGNLAEAGRTIDSVIERVREKERELFLGLEAQRYFLVAFFSGRSPEVSRRIERVADGVLGATTAEIAVRQAVGIDKYCDCAPLDEVLGLIFPHPNWPWMIGSIESPLPIMAAKILSWSGYWDRAAEFFEMVVRERRQQRRILASANGHTFLSEAFRLGGRLHDAETEARTAWEIAKTVEGLSSYMWLSMTALGAALLARGDISGFKEVMGPIDLSLGPLETPANPFPIELRAGLRLEEGDLEGAAADLLSFGEKSERAGLLNPAYPSWRQDAAEVLAALGRVEEAHELLAVAEERAQRFGAPHALAAILRARAMTESRDRSIDMLREASVAFSSSGPPHQLAHTLVVLGGALRRRGDRAEAREVLSQAATVAEVCGAGGIEGRARDELVAAGGSRRPRPVTGVGALTSSELRTAKLAAAGLTNKEIAERLFVTLRTVETHLTHVYEKLQIEGRPKLPGALVEVGP